MRVMTLNDHWLPHTHSSQLCEILQEGAHIVVKPDNKINQSINQSINQPINQSIINQSINQSINGIQPFGFSGGEKIQTLNLIIFLKQSVNRLVNQSINHIIISNQPFRSLREQEYTALILLKNQSNVLNPVACPENRKKK